MLKRLLLDRDECFFVLFNELVKIIKLFDTLINPNSTHSDLTFSLPLVPRLMLAIWRSKCLQRLEIAVVNFYFTLSLRQDSILVSTPQILHSEPVPLLMLYQRLCPSCVNRLVNFLILILLLSFGRGMYVPAMLAA